MLLIVTVSRKKYNSLKWPELTYFDLKCSGSLNFLADGLINISDLKTIMVEIGEEMNDRELNEMIKATGTLDGKGLFYDLFKWC